MSVALRSDQSNWLGAYTKLVVASVLVLIFFGALVKSNDAGLAVPDWPTSYQQGMFQYPPSQWVGGIFYEHVHRLIASGVGFLTFILALWVFFHDKRSSVRYLALMALFLVIVQGILGGLTVLYMLPTYISASHGVIGQTFMVMLIVLAYFQSTEWKQRTREVAPIELGEREVFPHALLFTALVWIQLVVAAIMRHTDSGIAVLDFPTMGGAVIPSFGATMLEAVNALRREVNLYPVSMFQVSIHLLHRLFAFVICFYALYIVFRVASRKRSRSKKVVLTARAVLALVVIQFILGLASLWTLTSPVLTSIHVLGGAILLGASVVLTLRSLPIQNP